MDDFKKVAGYNLLILLGYTIVFSTLKSIGIYSVLGIWAFTIVVHAILNLILFFMKLTEGKGIQALVFLLSGGLVLLIGISTCSGFQII